MNEAQTNGDLRPGFADPVADAQGCFRALLDAMSRPGTVRMMPAFDAPPPLDPAAACVLLTLVDQETPLWLDASASAARHWIAFHTGAPAAALPQASFALGIGFPDPGELATGTDEAPEQAATLIVQVQSLSEGQELRLSGPGLRVPQALRVTGLPPDFTGLWQRNHALFPRGFDLILCAGRAIAALPRSVTVQEG